LLAQPPVVRAGPGGAAGIDDAVAQQQLGQPVPGAHQITAAVFASADQVSSCFLLEGRHADGADLAQAQQPSQMHRVFRVGLDPVT
jgi:hypothetical protein